MENKNIKNSKDFDGNDKEKFNAFKDQLLIILIRRLGGVVDIPILESSNTGNYILFMESDPEKGFHFEVKKKTDSEKVAIGIDIWKLSIFKKELEKEGFKYKKKAGITIDTLTLMVKTNDFDKLREVIKTANQKAENSKLN